MRIQPLDDDGFKDTEWSKESQRLKDVVNDLQEIASHGLSQGESIGGGNPFRSKMPGDPVTAKELAQALKSMRAACRQLEEHRERLKSGPHLKPVEDARNPRWEEFMSHAEFEEIFKRSGLSQMQFAAAVSASQSMIARILGGQRRITEGLAYQIRRYDKRL